MIQSYVEFMNACNPFPLHYKGPALRKITVHRLGGGSDWNRATLFLNMPTIDL